MKRDHRIVRTVVLVASAALLMPATAAFAQDHEAEPADQRPSRPTTIEDARDLYMSGAYEKAIEAYETLRDDPRHALPAALGLARTRMQIGDYDKALTGLLEVESKADADWHYVVARLYQRKGLYPVAIDQAQQAVDRDANHAGARLLIGQLQEMLGQREQAIETYRWFDGQVLDRAELPRDAEWITHAAIGFLRYSEMTRTKLASRTRHVLNRMLQVAYGRVDRTYWPARLAAADLLRQKYNNDEDDGSLSDYAAALKLNEHLPQAYVGIGEVALDHWQFEEVERQAEKALALNPNYAEAIHLLAKKLVVERRYEEAISTSQRALALNPNDVAALSIQAAAHACRFDDQSVNDIADRVGAITPRSALFHRTMGDALSGIRQYQASERAFLKAIESDPTEANARTELGMMYMQWGLEEKAREALEAAWALDPFNERTKFTLELLEMLEKFDRVETPHFVVKYDAKADPGLGRFVADYMEDIYQSVTDDYETPTSVKTVIELFPTHRAFGVRITGRPWIYTVGASTGSVIALSSPRDRTSMGPYNLARVLKHEFTHTVTLEATGNRIPHWFTEGLAVYQEDAPRTFSWSQLLAESARRDRLFTLESIDWGFIRPKRANDRQLAYAQSEWMCEYIVEHYGYDVINRMLKQYRSGRTQTKVLADLLDTSLVDFDRDFQTWARKQVEQWGFDLTPPEDVEALLVSAGPDSEDGTLLGRLARAILDAGDVPRAAAAARRALEIDDNEPVALRVLAEALAMLAVEAPSVGARRKYDDEAVPVLERLLKLDPDAWVAPKYLGEIMLRREEFDRAIELLKRLQRICPTDPASWRGLAGIYLERGQDDPALPQLLELVRMEETEADVAAGIARILRKKDRLREAQYWYRQALYADPFNVSIHERYADTCLQAGDTDSALNEYKMLIDLEPGSARHLEKAALAAHKLGDREEAARLAGRAVELDPASSARSLLP